MPALHTLDLLYTFAVKAKLVVAVAFIPLKGDHLFTYLCFNVQWLYLVDASPYFDFVFYRASASRPGSRRSETQPDHTKDLIIILTAHGDRR